MDPMSLAIAAQLAGGQMPGQQQQALGQGLSALGAQQGPPAPGLAGAAAAGLGGLSTGLGAGMQRQGLDQLAQFLRQPKPPLGALQMGQQGIDPTQNGGLQWGG